MHDTHTERLGTDRRAGSRQLAATARALESGRAGSNACVAIGLETMPQPYFAARTCAGSGLPVRTP